MNSQHTFHQLSQRFCMKAESMQMPWRMSVVSLAFYDYNNGVR
jgi:hypothetical protein